MKRMIMTAAIASGVVLTGQAGAADTPEALAGKYTCTACHAVDKKLVGPAFKDVAAKYKAEDKAKLIAKVRKGGSGTWGAIPMPPNPTPSDADLDAIVTWVLSRK